MDRWWVLRNREGQYTIWPYDRWYPFQDWTRLDQVFNSKAEALEYIKSVWTDLRPRSLQ